LEDHAWGWQDALVRGPLTDEERWLVINHLRNLATAAPKR
jgi:hypothetical protein